MKYVAFIGLGLVLLLTICGVVLWANMPTARLTIHGVRPMGTNFTWESAPSGERLWETWEVAVTNNGRAPANWITMLLVKDSKRAAFQDRLMQYAQEHRPLHPGHGNIIYMDAPSDPKALWTFEVRYVSAMSSLESRLSSWLTPVPKLRRLLPNGGYHFAADTWHSGTNVTTAH